VCLLLLLLFEQLWRNELFLSYVLQFGVGVVWGHVGWRLRFRHSSENEQ
jgi:hypothetical protein